MSIVSCLHQSIPTIYKGVPPCRSMPNSPSFIRRWSAATSSHCGRRKRRLCRGPLSQGCSVALEMVATAPLLASRAGDLVTIERGGDRRALGLSNPGLEGTALRHAHSVGRDAVAERARSGTRAPSQRPGRAIDDRRKGRVQHGPGRQVSGERGFRDQSANGFGTIMEARGDGPGGVDGRARYSVEQLSGRDFFRGSLEKIARTSRRWSMVRC